MSLTMTWASVFSIKLIESSQYNNQFVLIWIIRNKKTIPSKIFHVFKGSRQIYFCLNTARNFWGTLITAKKKPNSTDGSMRDPSWSCWMHERRNPASGDRQVCPSAMFWKLALRTMYPLSIQERSSWGQFPHRDYGELVWDILDRVRRTTTDTAPTFRISFRWSHARVVCDSESRDKLRQRWHLQTNLLAQRKN